MISQKEELLRFADEDIKTQMMNVVKSHKYLLTKQLRVKALGSSSASNQRKHGEHMLACDGVPVLSSAKSRDDFVMSLLQKVSTYYFPCCL